MTCAACSAKVEKTIEKLPGVESVSVNLLTNSMVVEGDVSRENIRTALERVGYGLGEPQRIAEGHATGDEFLADTQTPLLKRRLWLSSGFLAILMYVSMGGVMLGWPLPIWLSTNPSTTALLQALLTVVVMVINRRFFVSGYKALWNKAPNMDTLVALGSGAAFVYSAAVLFVMTMQPEHGEHLLHELYFESAAMILTLITVGKMLEAKSKGETTKSLWKCWAAGSGPWARSCVPGRRI